MPSGNKMDNTALVFSIQLALSIREPLPSTYIWKLQSTFKESRCFLLAPSCWVLFCSAERSEEGRRQRSRSSLLSSGSSSYRNPVVTLLSPHDKSLTIQISIMLSPHLMRLHYHHHETNDLPPDVSTLPYCLIKKYLVTYSSIREHFHSVRGVEITQTHSKESGKGTEEQINCCLINLCNRETIIRYYERNLVSLII